MGFVYNQLFKRLPYPTGSYAGKTVIVTGSNTGLGLEAARHFARLGASKLILGVRNLKKGEEAKKDIESTTKCGKNVIEVWKVDMSSYDSVKQFATKVNKKLERLDTFLANAGVAKTRFELAEENETSITVNVVSTFLLVGLIMPKLKETALKFHTRPNLTITSSEVHAWTKFPAKSAPEGKIFDTLSDKDFLEKNMGDQYQVTKLLEVLAVRYLVEHHDFPVTIDLVNPGFCKSQLGREVNSWIFSLGQLILAISAEAGSRNLVFAASRDATYNGNYVSYCELTQPSDFVLSDEGKKVQERVGNELMKKLETIQPGITENF
ncbi:hypothetical protein FOA43_002727 [Brettanomyces nanus]|uniref:Uncharacterized protein n=1 Tax=Eeniella nana TaxID=13502 RepID=A0A875S8D4_EENNA|nr:uncharacterized protein FOA43_002727 [Brettanomyces nanus]QPG75374.1 hypothetical protein FOA43_002727 [Brettanomyces nanus]